MHPPALRSPRHTALLLLAGQVARGGGAFAAAALTLVWHADHGTDEPIRLSFLVRQPISIGTK